MSTVLVSCIVLLMLGWTGLGGPLQVPPRPTVTDQTSASTVPLSTPCLVDDIFAALREEVEHGGVPTNGSLALFGLCAASDLSSVLSELAEEIRRDQTRGPEVLMPAAVLVSEESERGAFLLTFVLPQSALLKLNPVLLLLVFERPLARGDLQVTFTSQSVQPDTQSVCITGATRYVVLAGRPSESDAEQKWVISVQTNTRDTKDLKDIVIGGKPGSNISMTPLLLFPGEKGTNTRHTHQASPKISFICELKRFLGASDLPQDPPEFPLVQLDSLQSLPPLMLGLSSSETLLAGMINSSAPTIFSFTGWSSAFPLPHGELNLSAALLEELRRRLEEITETIREERNVSDRTTERLRRLKELTVWQEKELATGERQYCAFLLLKAVQTVAHTFYLQRRLRATRAHPTNRVTANVCGLRSLVVSLEKVLVGPNTANINNCHGSCAFPLTNANNHAVQLHYHIESGHLDERAPCCVPVAYEGLEVMELNQQGTYISTKPDVIATECGCR